MKVTTNIDAGAVNYREHVLYVEGDAQSIDAEVLKELVGNILWIQPLGPASSIRSVAESLYPTHPKSYFLIDRDHHITDEKVDACWHNFPDPNTHNLLIWRRKELENYFLEPSFLIRSRFCRDQYTANDGKELQAMVVSLANGRLYLDAANYVIVSLREDFKRNWVENFSEPMEFSDEQAALDRLIQAPEFKAFAEKVSKQTAEQEITARFQAFLVQMTGGRKSLEWGIGSWLNMISGKTIFHNLVSQCFQVTSVEGTILQGKPAINLVAKDLLKTGENLPGDLVELKRLIGKRVQGGVGT